jgi:hypothetical protein
MRGMSTSRREEEEKKSDERKEMMSRHILTTRTGTGTRGRISQGSREIQRSVRAQRLQRRERLWSSPVRKGSDDGKRGEGRRETWERQPLLRLPRSAVRLRGTTTSSATALNLFRMRAITASPPLLHSIDVPFILRWSCAP